MNIVMVVFSQLSNTVTILSAIIVLAVGSGGGGIVGALVMLRKLKMERDQQRTNQDIGMLTTTTAQFEALFPGGLGQAVTVFQDQARDLYAELVKVRESEKKNHAENIRLSGELEDVKGQLRRAERRIAYLEAERDRKNERNP